MFSMFFMLECCSVCQDTVPVIMLAIGLALVPCGEEVISCAPQGVMVYHTSVQECGMGDTTRPKWQDVSLIVDVPKCQHLQYPREKTMVKKR